LELDCEGKAHEEYCSTAGETPHPALAADGGRRENEAPRRAATIGESVVIKGELTDWTCPTGPPLPRTATCAECASSGRRQWRQSCEDQAK
jgi:hypothetical protein